MKKLIILMPLLLSIISSIFFGYQSAKYQDIKDKIKKEKKEIIKLNNNIKEKNNQKEEIDNTYNNLKKQNEEKVNEYNEWKEKVKEIQKLLS